MVARVDGIFGWVIGLLIKGTAILLINIIIIIGVLVLKILIGPAIILFFTPSTFRGLRPTLIES